MAIFEFESDLFAINDLMNLLGCKDIRTVRNWCKTNGLRLIKFGKRLYVSRSAIEAIVALRLSSVGNPAQPASKIVTPTPALNKKMHSKAALEYIRKFKFG